ncbi:MAG: hypothetical protein ACRC6I_16885, partial [Paracoccaceae bacterium]
MIHPLRDFRIALAILLIGLAACAFAAFGPGTFDQSPPRMIAAAAGGFVALFGGFITANFYWAMRLARKLITGKDVIANWTIPAADMRAFLAADATSGRQRNLWRPKPDAAQRDIAIRFGPELILADGQLLSIPTVGTQCFRAVHVIPSQPPVIAFAIHIMVTRG